MNSIRDALVGEHAHIDQALTTLACAAEGADAVELDRVWAEVETVLLRHLEFEERELFPLAEPLHPGAVKDLRSGHDHIRKVLVDLGVRAELHTLRRDRVDELVETLRRHAEHEDRTLYRWVETDAPEDTRRHVLRLLVRTVRNDLRSTEATPSQSTRGAGNTEAGTSLAAK